MNQRLTELMGVVNRSAQHRIGLLLALTRVHDFHGEQALRLLGDTVPLGENGNRYEIRLYPAIANVEAVPDCSKIEFAFVVFSPTGELKRQRDLLERMRRPDAPNMAFIEMCADLMPILPEVTSILDTLTDDLAQLWPHRKLVFTVMAPSAELDVVAAFVDIGSFRQLVLEAGRRAAAG
jgi:hypothetical protein